MNIALRNRNEKTGIVILVLMLFLSSSFVVTNDIISPTMTAIMWFVVLLMTVRLDCYFSGELMLGYVSMVYLIWLTNIIHGESLRSSVYLSFTLLLAACFVARFSFEVFREVYIRALYFLCITSLVLQFAYTILPGLDSISVVSNLDNKLASNLYLFVHFQGSYRNCGMFWEPGAYQAFISLALLFELTKAHSFSVKHVLVFCFTLFTTFSTTGYIALTGLLLLLTHNSHISRGSKVRIYVALGIVIVFILCFYSDLLFSTSSSTVFGKLHGFTLTDSPTQARSVDVRVNSIVKPALAFLESPITGWGYSGLVSRVYSTTNGMITCTLVNWFAVYGFFFGLIAVCGMLGFSRLLTGDVYATVVALILLFLITCSENYVHNPSIYMLALYGFQGRIVPSTME